MPYVTFSNPNSSSVKNMIKIVSASLSIIINIHSFSQSISGQVISEKTQQPLAYVTIQVINKGSGTITDENGLFKLNANSFSQEAEIKLSMIGFETQIVGVKGLIDHENIFRMKEHTVQLSEVIVRPKKIKVKTLGTKSSSTKNVTGWGGCGNCNEDLGGIERGIRIDTRKPVFVEKVNFHVAYFGYDSMLLRLHVRKIEDDLPAQELLNNNIYVRLKTTGWHEIDLRKYNLSFSQDVAVSLEWVKAWGKTKGKENSLKLSLALFKGTLFGKNYRGNQWDVHKPVSPAIYLTVEEL